MEIDRRISPTTHLQLVFRDSAGRTVKSEQVRAQLALSKDRRDFLELDPGYLYGIRLGLLGKQLAPTGTKYYSLIYPPGNEIGQKFFLSSPGDYSLTVVYAGVDDGHLAGVTAWVGTLKSNKVSFRISR